MRNAALLGLDWGTSSLRAYLFDQDGKVLDERRSECGIMALPAPREQDGFPLALEQICGDWLKTNTSLPVLACGMVGSQQGWKEAAYFDCPADPKVLAQSLTEVLFGAGRKVHIVPGLIMRGDYPDVMRGEETQIVGAMGLASAASDHATIVLPGTHSKWARLDKGIISEFTTFMTGEVFAALSQNTILSRLITSAEGAQSVRDQAFQRGLEIAGKPESGGLLSAIFRTRTLGLTEQVPGFALADFLSGLLIGYEIHGVQEKFQKDAALYLIGDEKLVARYVKALAIKGFQSTVLKDATQFGLWRIACAAGLVP